MKRIYLLASLCLIAGASFAQKQTVKEAKSAMNSSNYKEARELIKSAERNEETKNDPETWKLSGDIEYKVFEAEKDKEMTKEMTGKGPDEVVMYTALYNLYDPYVKADELGQRPDAKGKIKNKNRKNIAKALKDVHPFYINGGIYYNDLNDYTNASKFFERYWDLPTLAVFDGDNAPFNVSDTTYQIIKYYAVITALQSKDHDRSIKLLNRIIAEPYINNSTYQESDVYELLANEYQQAGDSIAYINALRVGASKFPSNKYFTPNLINEFIRGGKNQEALDYLDQAIANDPKNACDLKSVKATLYADQKNYVEAKKIYDETITADPNCERSLEGLGILYVLEAQDVKDKASQATNRKDQLVLDKETADLYLKSLPYLEKYRDLLKAKGADGSTMKSALQKLQNVYYNLSLLNIDKSEELKAVEKELGL